MNAIDNSNLLNYRTQDTVDFVPSLTYAWDQNAQEIDFTDASSFPNGVALKGVKIQVFDEFGGEVRGWIGAALGSGSGHDGETTIDVSTLDASKGLAAKATVIADDDMLVADGIAKPLLTAGSLSSWDKQKNAKTVDPA